jgi:coenzyme F420-dependent glucose-6-phosphate dehydrogenase
MRIGYHASHEQFSPRELLDHTIAAERAGFDAAMCSDHLFPWSEMQGESGFAFSWLGAALQATSLPFGMVNAPGYRYHPVIVAQAAATLAQMYPDRFWIAIGSGEALNEHITGEPWPRKEDRNARLLECATIMRRLWNGETVTHRGHITAIDARVWSLPEKPPRLVGAAITAQTAEWMGGWADALITVSAPIDRVRKVLDAFRRGGGESKPVILQAKVSWHPDEKLALRETREQWATNVFPSSVAADATLPAHFEELAKLVTDERLRESVHISSSLAAQTEWLGSLCELGISELYIHNVNRHQGEFIDAFGREVLPALRERSRR